MQFFSIELPLVALSNVFMYLHSCPAVFRRTPLQCAAYGGYVNCMSVLIENKANTNTQDKEGMSALHWACSRGHLDAVKLLVEFRAFPNHMESTEDRYTPLGQFMSDMDLNRYLTTNVFFCLWLLIFFCCIFVQKDWIKREDNRNSTMSM